MKKTSLFVALLLALSMLTGLVAPALAQEETSVPLVVGQGHFSEKFSPFFSDTVYDAEIVTMTQAGMMVLDRKGDILYNGIEGETRNYGGTDYTYKGMADLSVDYNKDTDISTYTVKIRPDVVFSDGDPMTADDIIFTYYVYLDPSYAGSTSLNAFDIIGLKSYQTQLPEDIYTKYNDAFEAVYAAGADHVWAEGDAWTKEEQDFLWATLKETWAGDVELLTKFVWDNYASMAADVIGVSAEKAGDSEGIKVALGMAAWGFAGMGEDGVITAGTTGKTWTLKGNDMPTLADFYDETFAKYEGNPADFWSTELPDTGDTSDVLETTRTAFLTTFSTGDAKPEGGIPNIAGIKKVDDYTVQVQIKGFQAPAVYSVLGLSVAPMHYYGDLAQYDYENNKFGFPFGDISIVQSKTRTPLGAGPYKFVKYENKVVYLEANEKYWAGEPKIKYLQYKETNNQDLIPGVQTGTIDLAGINGSKKDFAAVSETNSNKEITGDAITSSLVNNRGYGYIGLNADRIRVGTDSFSDASKNLRKALSTVLAVYRDVSYDSYYGEAAVVINYPISNVIWAAPLPTDEGYKVAFSTDVNGADIYTSAMTADEKYAIALETAKGFFIAAGYTFDEATGKFTAAPEGAAMTYEVTIPAGGAGDHPSFSVITDASNALAKLGIELKINDLSETAILWDMLDAGTADMWCAAWQNNNPDPDMYQTYYSKNIKGLGGTDSNHYHVALPELDKLIMDGRQSADQVYRKAIYKQALDIIVDAAVEVPCYQRQNAILFSTQRINMGTMTPDITTWWDWYDEVELMQMNAAQ